MNLRSFVVFALLMFGARAAVPAIQESAEQNQRLARTIVDHVISALGGQAYLTLEDSDAEGRTGQFENGRSPSSVAYRRLWQWPDKERIEYNKARDVADVIVGDDARQVTAHGVRELAPAQDPGLELLLSRRHHSLEVVLRQWLNQPGTTLFYEGKTLSENHEVERVTLITQANDAVTLSIDTATHLPVKNTFVVRDSRTKEREQVEEIYDNWKVIQGINTPYSLLITVNGDLRRQYFLTSIRYNNHFSAALFSFSPSPSERKP